MFNRKSSYALNKKDPNAIVYMDANEAIIRLTREDFASEEEFLKWKSWSDGNYHTEDNQDVVEGKHNTSIDGLSEAAFSIPAIDVVMERQHEKSERCRMASTMVSQIRDKLTETQFRRLWMYYIDGMTVDEIGEKEGVSHQAASLSIVAAVGVASLLGIAFEVFFLIHEGIAIPGVVIVTGQPLIESGNFAFSLFHAHDALLSDCRLICGASIIP